MCRNEAKIHEKSASELNKKRCFKTELKQPQQITKNNSNMALKNKGILTEMRIGAPLVVQTVFVMKKLAPSAPKVRPRTKNEPK